MTHRLTNNYAKNYCNPTLIVKVIVGNVVTRFLGTQCRVLGLPDGEEIMPLAFFVLTQYRRVTDGQTDGQTDTLRSLLPALA